MPAPPVFCRRNATRPLSRPRGCEGICDVALAALMLPIPRWMRRVAYHCVSSSASPSPIVVATTPYASPTSMAAVAHFLRCAGE